MKVPTVALVVAGADGVRLSVPVTESLAPGGSCDASVQATEDEVVVQVKNVPVAVPAKVHPEGALTVKAVIAYELPLGFEIFMVATGVVPVAITLGLIEMVGRLEFAAFAGATAGTSMRSPESANSARTSPELIFV